MNVGSGPAVEGNKNHFDGFLSHLSILLIWASVFKIGCEG